MIINYKEAIDTIKYDMAMCKFNAFTGDSEFITKDAEKSYYAYQNILDTLDAMGQYILDGGDSPPLGCLMCQNNMKNISLDKQGVQGCDGNCNIPNFTVNDIIERFYNG